VRISRLKKATQGHLRFASSFFFFSYYNIGVGIERLV